MMSDQRVIVELREREHAVLCDIDMGQMSVIVE